VIAVIDVGNTNAVIGLFEGETLHGQWRAASDMRRTADEWHVLLQQFLAQKDLRIESLDGIAIGSVVPPTTLAITQACEIAGVTPLVVNASVDSGMPILIDVPTELGADRIANGVAAFSIYGGPVVVVDMGTATAFDVVSAQGEFIGGIILPGVNTSLDALFSHTSLLKRVQMTPPARVVGRNTADAVRSGATYGFAAQVDGLCERIEDEIGPCRIVATGGFSNVIAPLSQHIQLHDPALTLRGLRLIHERTTKRSS
jgi:type III pantothenate kinase